MTTVTITNQYTTSKIEGSRKEVLNTLRNIALEKRRQFRDLYNMPLNVHRTHTNRNEIVNVASFEINNMPLPKLVNILNYGIEKYKITED